MSSELNTFLFSSLGHSNDISSSSERNVNTLAQESNGMSYTKTATVNATDGK